MNIDERINTIMKKMEKLSEKHPEYPCGKFPPQWDAPLTEQAVEEYEKKNGITLPADYRRFITTVAAGGTQPFYGLYNIAEELKNHEDLRTVVNKKFPYTIRTPLFIMDLSEEEMQALYEPEDELLEADAGFVQLCHEGCGMFSILIVNTDDEDTYGTVWYYDFANDAGTAPLINPGTNKPMSFLDWLEYYVDRTLELGDSDYFGYAELAGRIE